MDRTAQYPYHLARLVATRLRAEYGDSPPEAVLARLLETLYFASLKTDEGRPVLCTVNYLDPQRQDLAPPRATADHWSHVPFDRPLSFDVRTLAKLARAADPAVSSLAVYRDPRNRLFIWGMIDQEPRHSDYITLDPGGTPERPGLFQATITGPGNISVYNNDALIGSLEQNTLVQEYHDVLWAGPVHNILTAHLRSFLASEGVPSLSAEIGLDAPRYEGELLMRWLNAICRILMNIQRYRHGGGLLIVPQATFDGLNVNYHVTYDRLLKALVSMVHTNFQFTGGETAAENANLLSYANQDRATTLQRKINEHKNEVLGAVRFIASLSCVDGFVLVDKHMIVHGFGVEVRTDNPLSEIFVARDSLANPSLLRKAELTQYGTRHRAMMRYCFDNEGSLGFVVSQDGDIRAMTRLGETLVLWENIDVQLAYRAEEAWLAGRQQTPMLRRVNTRVA